LRSAPPTWLDLPLVTPPGGSRKPPSPRRGL